MFTTTQRRTVLIIVHIFETSKKFGRPDTIAALKDGAGISYGSNQFTHRSGSLAAVVKRFLNSDVQGFSELNEYLDALDNHTPGCVKRTSEDTVLKSLLRRAGKTRQMQEAQDYVAFANYLKPALEACDGSGFVLPLSLGVIYDSLNHGSYAKIRDKVIVKRDSYSSLLEYEKAWITAYCGARNLWLRNTSALLANTAYRPEFFLRQIKNGNWELNPPFTCFGVKITKADLVYEDVATSTEPEPEPEPEEKLEKSKKKSLKAVEVSGNSAQTVPVVEGGGINDKPMEVQTSSPSFLSYVVGIGTMALGWLTSAGIAVAGIFEKGLAFFQEKPNYAIPLVLVIAGMIYWHYAKERSKEKTLWEAKNRSNPADQNVTLVGE